MRLVYMNIQIAIQRTPLDSFQNGGFERFRKPGMQSPCFLALALDSLKVVESALASDLALELLQAVERHAGRICSRGHGGEGLGRTRQRARMTG